MDAVRELGDRIWHVHFKDADPAVMAESRATEWHGLESTGHGVFCELGKGCVDFPGVLAALGEIGYDGWIVVEQDILPGMGNPRESARRNREYLRSIGALIRARGPARHGRGGGMTDKVRIGVVGTSWWADAMYLPALANHPLADVRGDRRRQPCRRTRASSRRGGASRTPTTRSRRCSTPRRWTRSWC